MVPGIEQHKQAFRGAGCLGILIAVIFALGFLLRGLGDVPASQADVEAHLDREILAYAVVEDIPFVVFQLGDRVYLDRLILDWISIEWPPTPRWQWTGQWTLIPATTAPASGTAALLHGQRIVYGQLNSTDIVTIQVEVDGQWQSFPVSGAGFIVRLPDTTMYPTAYRWLDADGRQIPNAPAPSTTRSLVPA